MKVKNCNATKTKRVIENDDHTVEFMEAFVRCFVGQ